MLIQSDLKEAERKLEIEEWEIFNNKGEFILVDYSQEFQEIRFIPNNIIL